MRLFFRFICVALLLLGCSVRSQSITESTQVTISAKKVSSGYYNIQDNQDGTYGYTIYNHNGELILAKDHENTYPEIHMLDEYIVDIMVSRGTGLAEHIYCDVKNSRVSDPFIYVYGEVGENILRMDFPNEEKMKNRCLVVHNMFDNTPLYDPIYLDFAPVDTPVLSAKFSADGKHVEIIYLAGDEAVENKVFIDLLA